MRPLMRVDPDHHRTHRPLPSTHADKGPRQAYLIPDRQPLAPLSSHATARPPRSWHIVGRPGLSGRQLVKEPAPREPPDATTPAATPPMDSQSGSIWAATPI